MNKYKAIFFDWDGTAVVSRTASTEEVIKPMIELLKQGIKLIIISGTTYDNIAGGKLHTLIPKKNLENLYLGLGRGAYNYSFVDGKPTVINSIIPNLEEKLVLHKITFMIHQHLLESNNLNTDIVFSRPNYCKLDIMVDLDRKDKLFLQANEITQVETLLREHKFKNGLKDIMSICKEIGQKNNMSVEVTTDAKYVEIGMSTKSDNVDYFVDEILKRLNVGKKDCCFLGDEFTYLTDGIKGSDAFMITDKTMDCDFFDVSYEPIKLPEQVIHLGGGTGEFICFLNKEINL